MIATRRFFGVLLLTTGLLASACNSVSQESPTGQVSATDSAANGLQAVELAQSLVVGPFLGPDRFTPPDKNAERNSAAGMMASSGALEHGWITAKLTPAELRLQSAWTPNPDRAATFSLVNTPHKVAAFYKKHHRLPQDSAEMISVDFGQQAMLERLMSATPAEQMELLAVYFNPATGQLYETFTADDTVPFGLNVTIQTRDSLDQSDPALTPFSSADGSPVQVRYVLHATLRGEDPTRQLMDLVTYID